MSIASNIRRCPHILHTFVMAIVNKTSIAAAKNRTGDLCAFSSKLGRTAAKTKPTTIIAIGTHAVTIDQALEIRRGVIQHSQDLQCLLELTSAIPLTFNVLDKAIERSFEKDTPCLARTRPLSTSKRSFAHPGSIDISKSIQVDCDCDQEKSCRDMEASKVGYEIECTEYCPNDAAN